MSEPPEEGGGGADGALSSLRTRAAGVREAPLSNVDQVGSGQGERSSGHMTRRDEKIENVKQKVKQLLDQDLLACDVQMSLFVAASTSYRHDSTLRPFPPMFLHPDTGEREVEELVEVLGHLPSLASLREGGLETLSSRLVRLVVWVLEGGPAHLQMKTLSRGETEEVLGGVGVGGRGRPSYVVSVSTGGTARWCREMQERDTCWAFHGSRLDNFYSILNYGLQQHRTKVSLFGEGIYLSEDLGVCLTYSTRGVGWEKSGLGPSLSCVALAEVVTNHPSVKRTTEQVEGSEGGSVPEKYIVVRNNELLHIRYLMVYKHNTVGKSFRNSRLATFLSRNKMAVSLTAYAVMLALIGLSKSQWFRRWMRKNGYSE